MKKNYLNFSFLFPPDSNYYGHYNILKNYCDYDNQFLRNSVPYYIFIQHGSGNLSLLSQVRIPKTNGSKKKYNYLVWTKDKYTDLISAGLSNVHITGAPFIYLNQPRDVNNNISDGSLLLFPSHSCETVTFKDRIKVYSNYLNRIDKIKSYFSKISVCLYWFDYLDNNLREMLKKRNYQIVTLGHRDDPSFLNRYYNLVSNYEYVSSNTFGTSIFYSLYLRKKVFVYDCIDGLEALICQDGTSNLSIPFTFPEPYKTKYSEILWENFDDKSHYWIGDFELGINYKMKPAKLQKILHWEYLDLIDLDSIGVVLDKLQHVDHLFDQIKQLKKSSDYRQLLEKL